MKRRPFCLQKSELAQLFRRKGVFTINEKLKEIFPDATDEQIASVDALINTESERIGAEQYELGAGAVREEFEKYKLSTAVDDALRGAGAKNIKASRALLNLEGAAFENGEVKGLAEQIETIKSENPYLFGGNPGEKLPQFTASPKGVSHTKESFKKLGYRERLSIFNENPELYKQLSEN